MGDGAPPTPGRTSQPGVAPTRLSAAWTGVAAAVVILTLVVIFIAENTAKTSVTFLGFHGRAPTGVLLLAALIVGAALVLLVGAARILQLRHAAHGRPARSEPTSARAPLAPDVSLSDTDAHTDAEAEAGARPVRSDTTG